MNANQTTVLFGALFGAAIVFLILYGLHTRFDWSITTKWYVISAIAGAGLSLFLGQKSIAVDEKGVLSLLDNYTESTAEPGFFWELPGIIGIKTVSAKQTSVKVTLKGPKLKGSVTLMSAEGTITYVVKNVRVAATVNDLGATAKALCESSMRTFIATQEPDEIENGRTDLRASLALISEDSVTKLEVLDKEADEVGIEIKSLFLDSAELPAALVTAKNQQVIEDAERIAQDKERAQREKIIIQEMSKGATYAEAQAEADRVTGKRSTLTTNQVTGGGRPLVVLGQNQQGGGNQGSGNGNGGNP